MMSEQAVRTTLTRVLSTGPMMGARFRPLLVQELRRATGLDLESYIRSFGKFSAFLARKKNKSRGGTGWVYWIEDVGRAFAEFPDLAEFAGQGTRR